MSLGWEEISTAVTVIGAVYTGTRHVVVRTHLAMKKFVREEIRDLSSKVDTLSENYKSLSARMDALSKGVEEMRIHQTSARVAMGEMQNEVRTAIEKNTTALKDVQKSKVEWLTKELAVIRGQQPKKGEGESK